MKIYHNPRCTKSRETLQLLQDAGQEPEVILYLQTPPNREELQDLLKKLDLKPSQLIRKGEKIYKEQYKDQKMTEARWLTAMLKHPQLIERPIVVKGKKAVIGRPPELALDLVP